MNTSRWLFTLRLLAAASFAGQISYASSITNAASASISCRLTAVFQIPAQFGGGTTSSSVTKSVTASGANSASPSCPSWSAADNPPLPPGSQLISSQLIGSSSAGASGSATYGTIQGGSSALSGLGGTLGASSSYAGSFDDAITVSGGAGLARFVWVLTGRGYNAPGPSGTNNSTALFVDGVQRANLVLPVASEGTQTFQFDRAFNSGDTISFGSAMSLPASSGDFGSNTADLTMSLQFLQSDGSTPLSGLTVASDSGTQYTGTPEPGSVVLSAVGLLLCAAGMPRRR